MSFVLLGILNSQAAAGGSFTYYFSLFGDGDNRPKGMDIDSLNNAYGIGVARDDNSGPYLACKFGELGVVQWQRQVAMDFEETGGRTRPNAVGVDSLDNVIFGGSASGSGGKDLPYLTKFNSSGNQIWELVLGANTGAQAPNFKITTDSSNNIYTTGDSFVEANRIPVYKYNSSGSLIFATDLTGNTFDAHGNDLALDSSNNVYVAARDFPNPPATDYNAVIAKFDSSGTIQWQKELDSGGNEFGEAIAVDSNDDIYLSGSAFLTKINSSGSLIWQRELSNAQFFASAVDSSNNVYVAGRTSTQGAGSNDFIIAKYDSSGTIQWQRTIGSTASETANDIRVDANDNLFVFGESKLSGNKNFFLAFIPSDGSLTGTYTLDGVDVEYSVSTLSSVTPSNTLSNLNKSVVSPSGTVEEPFNTIITTPSLSNFTVELN